MFLYVYTFGICVFFFILKMTILYTVHVVDTLEDTKKKMIIYNNPIITYYIDMFKSL